MSITFSQSVRPDQEYEEWIKNWLPPTANLMALPGWCIIEFAPFGNRGQVFCPEEASNNAIMVSDGNEPRTGRASFAHPDGYIKRGTEIIYTGTQGTYMGVEDRHFMRVPKHDVEMFVPKEAHD